MKEQLERDIEVLRKIEWLLNEELSQDTFNEYNFLTEWEEFKLAKSDLEFRLKSLEAKEKEVSIWDVIEECKGKSPEDIRNICEQYETRYFHPDKDYGEWHVWGDMLYPELFDTKLFEWGLKQLRLKERK